MDGIRFSRKAPTVDEVQREFPPDVALPICAILSAIRGTDELLPAPSQVVNREIVARYKELLDSDLYGRYAELHDRIGLKGGESALPNIRRKGVQLLKAGKGALANRRASVGIIPLVPKIVDTAFGKLPGTLAQFAADLALKLIDERRNLVIYQFDDWTNEYTKAALSRLVHSESAKV